jgi:CRP-like cAMP-binding protein
MDEIHSILLRTPLFAGIDEAGLAEFFSCLAPVRRSCAKGAVLLEYGQRSEWIGIVLSGRIEAYRPLPAGGRIPMASMIRGGIFGDVLSGAELESPVRVVAAEDADVLLLPCGKLMHPCARHCAVHQQFLHNLLEMAGRKYFALFERMEVLTMRSLRAKVSAYLLAESRQKKADTFQIEGTRSYLAEYLGCDRSALSREISHMQRDGLLETYKNSFKLLDKAALERLCQG